MYALDVTISTIKARMQHFGLFYDRKYDIVHQSDGFEHYEAKLEIDSSSSRTLKNIPNASKVLEFGCGYGALLKALSKKSCTICGVDQFSLKNEEIFHFPFYQRNLNYDNYPVNPGDYDYIFMNDVLEHLSNPERVLDKIYFACHFSPDSKIIASNGNIAFFRIRVFF